MEVMDKTFTLDDETKANVLCILNHLGLWDGLLYLEYIYNLHINQNLFLRCCHKNKENLFSYFGLQEKFLFAIYTQENLLNEVYSIPGWLYNKLKEFLNYLKYPDSKKQSEYTIVPKQKDKIWMIEHQKKEIRYIIKSNGNGFDVHDANIFEISFSFSAKDREWNIFYYLHSSIRDYQGQFDSNFVSEQNPLVNFVELLNTEFIHKMYFLWKKVSSFTLPMKLDIFANNPLFTTQSYLFSKESHSKEPYFTFCKDIVLGMLLRCIPSGIDKSRLEWGIIALIDRMILPLECRLFEIKIEYNIPEKVELHENSKFYLGKQRLGYASIGKTILNTWSKIRVLVILDWEAYLLFTPGGKAYNFLQKVLHIWLAMQHLTAEIQILYRKDADRRKFALGLSGKIGRTGEHREGFAILGHTSFLMSEVKWPTASEQENCLSLKFFEKIFS